MGEGEQAVAAVYVAGEVSDGGEGEVEDGGDHLYEMAGLSDLVRKRGKGVMGDFKKICAYWKESIAVSKGITAALVKIEIL